MYYVYILKCQDGNFYTGMTVNMRRRLAQHTEEFCKYTRNRRPAKLVFYAVFPNKSLAAAFEKYLKSSSGKAFRNKRLIKLDFK